MKEGERETNRERERKRKIEKERERERKHHGNTAILNKNHSNQSFYIIEKK